MPLVETEYGTLNGIISDNNGEKYIAFKGIPYAKPPIGNLRFKVSINDIFPRSYKSIMVHTYNVQYIPTCFVTH